MTMMNIRMATIRGKSKRSISMSTAQIVVKTVVTTVDMLLTLSVIRADNTTGTMVKVFAGIILLNLMGVWI